MLRKINKRGQLKILESIAVLIVFFFLVGMGINFYAKIQIQSLNAAKAEFASLDATKISQKIIHMPEIRCSLQNTDKGSCIDLYQAKAWEAMNSDSGCQVTLGSPSLCSERVQQLFDQIGVGEVVLSYTYSSNTPPLYSLPVDIVLYNYTTDDVKSFKYTQIPVAIEDPSTKTTDLGMLKVKVYE